MINLNDLIEEEWIKAVRVLNMMGKLGDDFDCQGDNMILDAIDFAVILENDVNPLVQIGTLRGVLGNFILFPILSTPINNIFFPNIDPSLQVPVMILAKCGNKLNFGLVQGVNKLGIVIV